MGAGVDVGPAVRVAAGTDVAVATRVGATVRCGVAVGTRAVAAGGAVAGAVDSMSAVGAAAGAAHAQVSSGTRQRRRAPRRRCDLGRVFMMPSQESLDGAAECRAVDVQGQERVRYLSALLSRSRAPRCEVNLLSQVREAASTTSGRLAFGGSEMAPNSGGSRDSVGAGDGSRRQAGFALSTLAPR